MIQARFGRNLLSILLLIWPATAALAGVRHFGYVYEAVTSAPGSLDVENWVTWSHTSNPQRIDEVDFRHEFEFGITENFQASLYVADWFYATDPKHSGFTYSDSALELIYNLTNPVTDPVGLALYEEIRSGNRVFELESKLIAQKDLGPLNPRLQRNTRSRVGRNGIAGSPGGITTGAGRQLRDLAKSIGWRRDAA